MNLALQGSKTFGPNDIIHDQFLVLGKLDNKKHSSIILKGFDKITRNFVVIKITSAAYKEKNKIVTKILQKLGAGVGVPKIIWRGMEGPSTITVTECLGPNLKKLFLLMNKQFSIATISMIAIQVLNTLEYIHSHDYVCCNIMPKEILISLHKKSLTLFITDYKQARKVKSYKAVPSDSTSHSANKGILNKFSSCNLHLGLPNRITAAASKKDDLESLAYILVYFFRKGNLFEKNIKVATKEEKFKYYEQQKLAIVPETFCQGLPPEMGAFFIYVKSIQTNQLYEKIDYDYLKKQFRNLFNKHGSLENFQYDWIEKARTYNLDKDKHDNAKSPPEVNMSYFPNSEILNDMDDQMKQNGGSRLLSECDFFDVDEFNTNNSVKPGPPAVHRVGLFEEKIKTISHIKTNSVGYKPSGLDAALKNRSSSEEKNQGGISELDVSSQMLTSKNEDFQRNKVRSSTQIKVSRFGRAYANNVSKTN